MNAPSKRIASVDALRGLAVAAMLLVNKPGDWGYVYAPLEHAAWNGWTPTDLVFPFFLFIVGVSLSLAMGARIEAGGGDALRGTVVKRALRILVLGLVLHALAWWLMGKPAVRIPGVLQRFGLGIVATRGALATTLLGWRCGEALRSGALKQIATIGITAAAAGFALDAIGLMPINKNLWTPSFVLFTGGLAALALLGAHALIDRLGWPPLFRSFGVNAIAAYAGAWMCTVFLAGFGWMDPLYAHGFGWLEPLVGPYGRSLAFALAFVAVWWAIVRVLDARRLYIKV